MHTIINSKVGCLDGRPHPSEQGTHIVHERLIKLHSKVLHLVHVVYGLQPQGPLLPAPLLLQLQVKLIAQDESLLL